MSSELYNRTNKDDYSEKEESCSFIWYVHHSNDISTSSVLHFIGKRKWDL